jgi:hypothetical protein
MWVLVRIANDDWRIRDEWALMKAELELMGEHVRTKCMHCGKMTTIRSTVNVMQRRNLAEKIKRGDTDG